MFEKFFKRKKKNKEVKDEVIYEETAKPIELLPNAKLEVTKVGDFIKVEISPNLIPFIYEEKKKESGYSELLDLLSPAVYWNSSQMIKEGTYYIIQANNCIYNILLSGRRVTLDERMKLGDITKQINLEFDIPETEYHMKNISLSVLKHNEWGSTIDNKYFVQNFKYNIPNLELTQKEAYDEACSIIGNLETIEGISEIIDLDMVKKIVLEELKDKPLEPELKNN